MHHGAPSEVEGNSCGFYSCVNNSAAGVIKSKLGNGIHLSSPQGHGAFNVQRTLRPDPEIPPYQVLGSMVDLYSGMFTEHNEARMLAENQ
jgi:hypothetical protein